MKRERGEGNIVFHVFFCDEYETKNKIGLKLCQYDDTPHCRKTMKKVGE